MITEDDETPFHAALDANPADHTTRLIFADWLEQIGELVRANGQRWQAKNHKCPERPNLHYRGNCGNWSKEWNWWGSSRWSDVEYRHVLPDRVYGFVRALGATDQGSFPTRPAAELALAEALHALGIEA